MVLLSATLALLFSNLHANTPETKKAALVQKLNEKTSNIEIMDFTIQHGTHRTTRIRYMENMLRLDTFRTAEISSETIYLSSVAFKYVDHLTHEIMSGDNRDLSWFPVWYIYPLLSAEALNRIGSWTCAEEKTRTIISLSVPHPEYTSNVRIQLLLNKKDLSLNQARYSIHGTKYILTVTQHVSIHGFPFPSRATVSEIRYSRFKKYGIRIIPSGKTPEVSRQLFIISGKKYLPVDQSARPGDLTERIASAKDPFRQAGACYSMGMILLRAARRAEAAEYFRKSLEFVPNAVAPSLHLAGIRCASGDVAGADSIFTQLQTIYPELKQFLFDRKIRFTENTFPRTALQTAQQWKKEAPESFFCSLQLARFAEMQGKSREAEAIYTSLLKRFSNNPAHRIQLIPHLSGIYIDTGKLNQARKMLENECSRIRKSGFPIEYQPVRDALYQVYKFQGRMLQEHNAALAALRKNNTNIGLLETALETALQVSEYRTAGRLCEQLIQLVPDESLYYYRLADIYTHGGYDGKLANVYRKLLERFWPADAYFLERFQIASAQAGQTAQCRAFLTEKIDNFPDNPHLLETAALFYRDTGDLTTAITLVRNAVKADMISPDSFYRRLFLAKLLLQNSQHSQALDTVDRLLKTDELHPAVSERAVQLKINILVQSDKINRYIKELSAKAAHDASARTVLADAYFRMQKHEQAANEYEIIMEKEPDRKLIQRLSSCYMQSRDIQKLIQLCKKKLTLFPQDKLATLNELVDLCRQSKDRIAAVKYARQLYNRIPDSPAAFHQYADLLRSAEKHNQVTELYAKKVASCGEYSGWNSNLYLGLADAYLRTQNIKMAAKTIAEILEKTSSDTVRKNAIAKQIAIRKKTGTLAETIRKLSTACRDTPKEKQLKILAEVYAQTRQHEKAVSAYSRLVRKYPAENNYLTYLDFLRKNNMDSRQIKLYKGFFTRFPWKKRSCITDLFFACKSAGSIQQTLTVAREMVQFKPDFHFVTKNYAASLVSAGKYAEALNAYQRARNQSTNSLIRESFRLEEADIYVKQNNMKAAIAILNDISETSTMAFLKMKAKRQLRKIRKKWIIDDIVSESNDPVVKNQNWLIYKKKFVARKTKDNIYNYNKQLPADTDSITVANLAFTKKHVWAATSRGAFVFDRKTEKWTEYAVDGRYIAKEVNKIEVTREGTIEITMTINGSEKIFQKESE